MNGLLDRYKNYEEKYDTQFYIGHIGLAWWAILSQAIHIFRHQSAQDVVIWLGLGLLLKQLLAIPKSRRSHIKCWFVCHVGSAILAGILLVGIILYK